MDVKTGVIGGSGIYQLESLKVVEELDVQTPFGKPSDRIIIGDIGSSRVAFLARHGRGHCLSPSEINSRANIYAFKSLGIRKIISISAVGSLKEEIEPGNFVLPDQLFDRTKNRVSTFFGNGIVGHVSFAEPFCADLRSLILKHCAELPIKVHDGGTYVCMEGPQFSTRAESHFYRNMGASVIGMTALPEAKLACEAEMCYATIALATDYDVWKEETVSVDMVLATLRKNSENVKALLEAVLLDKGISEITDHDCYHALDCAIMTKPELIPDRVYSELELLISRVVKR